MKLFYSLTVLIVFTFTSCTTEEERIELFPVKYGEKWGYVDSEGKLAINPQFLAAYNFSEGLATVRSTDGKYGFIDKNGKYAIDPIYVDMNFFREGLACVVMKEGKPQFINKKNEVVFTVESADICFGFNEGLAKFVLNDKFGFIDKNGKIVVTPIYEDAEDFSEGLAAVAIKDDIDSVTKWGYIDKSGVVKIDFQFINHKNIITSKPLSFNEGLAFASSDGEKWGYINKDGKYQINPQFDNDYFNSSNFTNGLALVYVHNMYGFIDRNGKYIINPQFTDARVFTENNLAAVQNHDNKWGFINKDGKYVINPQFDDVVVGFMGNLAFVQLFNKYGVINNIGQYIVNPQFDEVLLEDRDFNMYVLSDYFDYDAVAADVFKTSGRTQFLEYSKYSKIGRVFDDYYYEDNLVEGKYDLTFKKPITNISNYIEVYFIKAGIDTEVYSAYPIYKYRQKTNLYSGEIETVAEIDEIVYDLNEDANLTYLTLYFHIRTGGLGKGKNLAESLKQQAIKVMKVNEINDIGVKNMEFMGISFLKNDELLILIQYFEAEETKLPAINLQVFFNNFESSFEEIIKSAVRIYNNYEHTI